MNQLMINQMADELLNSINNWADENQKLSQKCQSLLFDQTYMKVFDFLGGTFAYVHRKCINGFSEAANNQL